MVKDSDIQESQIKAGDQLSVTWHGEKEVQTKQIRVNAILHASSEKNIHPPYPASSGICAVTGKNFWKQYGINTVDDYCEKVRILLDDTADAYDAETHILSCVKKAGNIDLINYLQVELMRRHRANKPGITEPVAPAGDSADSSTMARLKRGIQISVNGIASGLRNTG
mgnify:CR=1 FL=1